MTYLLAKAGFMTGQVLSDTVNVADSAVQGKAILKAKAIEETIECVTDLFRDRNLGAYHNECCKTA